MPDAVHCVPALIFLHEKEMLERQSMTLDSTVMLDEKIPAEILDVAEHSQHGREIDGLVILQYRNNQREM